MRLQSISHVLVAAVWSSAVMLSPSVVRADPPDAPRSVYRFDVSVTGMDEGPHNTPATYTITLLENQTGTVTSGANVPLSVPGTGSGATSVARQDVGFSLHLNYSLRGGVVIVSGTMEMSTVDPPSATTVSTIHRVRLDGVTPVTPGTPALFGRVYDIHAHHPYEMTVNAQRLL